MDTTRLKQIHDENAQKALAEKQHADLLSGFVQVSNTAIETTTSLIKYLEGTVSKVHVVNQLEEIGTPDALLVVDAINSLHATLQTHKDTDLSEVTSVMKAILEESKKIPKELPELKEREDKDYSDQLKSLEKAVTSVEKVIKAQKLIAEAPIVNVAPTDVKVEAPDLKPLQTAIKAVVTAVNKIVIPEYKTDNKAVEELLKKSNKLLKEIVEKPVSGGGGGGGRVSPYQTGPNAPAFVTLEADGSIPVTVVAGGSATAQTVTKIDDTTTANVVYIGKAELTGSAIATSGAVWQIKKLDTSTLALDKTWADSNDSFDNIWDNRTGLTYG